MLIRRFIPVLVPAMLAGVSMLSALPAQAQQNPGYFIPPSGQAPAATQPRTPTRPPQPRTPPAQQAAPRLQPPPPAGAEAQAEQPREIALPPLPDLPTLPKANTPPAAVIGVIGVPDVMRASTAAQQIERTIGERREKLNEDAAKEQAAWRELQQQLGTQRAGLSADQIRTRERELQERITNAQRSFQTRNRIIQEAAQYSLAQIERTLIAVIRQVAESRGMNLVLHRSQVALNVNEFDMTEQVVEQLNKIIPSVTIPPEGVSPATVVQQPAAGAHPATQPAAQRP